jgi:hypothetical protein
VPDRFIMPAAKALKPLTQGNLSRLCGLYCLLNGIRLAVYPIELRKDELQLLYLEAVRDLARRRQLTRVLGVGMSNTLWVSLGTVLTHQVNGTQHRNVTLGKILRGTAQLDRQRAFGTIKRMVASNIPVLTLFAGALNHYTTVCGFTTSRFLLFDSSGLHWIDVKHVGLGERCRRRHWIAPDSTLAIVNNGRRAETLPCHPRAPARPGELS